MRRTRLLANLVAAVSLGGAVLLIATSPVAQAETAQPGISIEAWYSRYKPQNPIVDTCPPTPPSPIPPAPGTPLGCGPTQSPAAPPTPNAKQTGAYVVASSGGNCCQSATSGDMGWAAFQWDLLDYSGVTVDKFVVTLTQAADTQGDSYSPQLEASRQANQPTTVPPIQACNIIEGFGGEAGSNPWDARPRPESRCVTATVVGRRFTFDVSSFAQSWVDGTGFGIVIMPGTPAQSTNLPPFQVTFSGTYDDDTVSKPPASSPPEVDFQFTRPPEDTGTDAGDGGFTGGDSGDVLEEITTTTNGGGDSGVLQAMPNIDVNPTDVGSAPLPEDVARPTPLAPRRLQPISKDTGIPLSVLLLVPLALLLFAGAGTALGPTGDPIPARRGGVSRVLSRRQAAAPAGPDSQTRY